MDRAKVVCVMLTSIDGKVQNQFHGHPDAKFAGANYEGLNYSCGRAIAVGRRTVDTGRRPDLTPYAGADIPYEDRIVQDECTYGVIFDRKGSMCWDGKYQTYAEIPQRRIIEVLTEQAPHEYLAYLRDLDIGYMIAGREDVDLALVLRKLKTDYGVETMVLDGGTTLNNAFMKADLIDEIKLVVAPGVNGNAAKPAFVSNEDPVGFPKFFWLKDAEMIGHNTVVLHYEKAE